MSTDASSDQPQRPFPGGMMGMGGRSLIEGPIAPALVRFSLPLLGTNVLQSLSMTIGAIWVSHVLGPNALTATVNAQILMMMLMGSVLGVGMAANIVVAQAFGAGDLTQVKRVVGTAMSFFGIASIALGAAGYAATDAVLTAMRTPPEAFDAARDYFQATCVSMPAIFVFMFAMMLMRGAGDARTPFTYSLMSILLGLVLSPILLTGAFGFPNLGIAGAVYGGLIANIIALAAMLIDVYRRDSPLALRGGELRFLAPNLLITRVLVLRGLPMGVQMFIISGASLVMLAMVNDYGAPVAAAYGAASQLWNYVQMPAMAIAASVSSMAAQNIGAGRWDRVGRIAFIGCLVAGAVTFSAVALLYALGDAPLRLFLPNGGYELSVAHSINLHVLWAWTPFAITFVLFGVVRANGAILPPTIILTVTLWLMRVPFAQALQPSLGMDAIWWSFPVGTIASAALAYAYYRWGGWRKNELMMAFARPAAAPPEAHAAMPEGAAAPIVLHEAGEDQNRRTKSAP